MTTIHKLKGRGGRWFSRWYCKNPFILYDKSKQSSNFNIIKEIKKLESYKWEKVTCEKCLKMKKPHRPTKRRIGVIPCEACESSDVDSYVNGRDEKIYVCRKCYHIVHSEEKKVQKFDVWINCYENGSIAHFIDPHYAEVGAEAHPSKRLGTAEHVVIERDIDPPKGEE